MLADLVVFPMFLGTLVFAGISFWVSMKLPKAKIGRWQPGPTVWFVRSVGNVGKRQTAMWRQKMGYSEEEANTIIDYQLLSLFGIGLGFVVSVLLGMLMVA